MTNFFNKIFRRPYPASPDNKHLLALLSQYWKKQSDNSYEQVVLEIMHGNCFLLLPSRKEYQSEIAGWHRTTSAQKIDLASLFSVEDKKLLAAFTDEKALFAWSKKISPYVSLRGQSVLELCKVNAISQLVIDAGSDNPFVLHRQTPPTEEYKIAEGTSMQIGIFAKPLDAQVVAQLIPYFLKTKEIEEVYQYGQTAKSQFSLVLGFKLSNRDRKLETSITNAVQAALGAMAPAYPIDLHFFEPGGVYEKVRAVKDSLFYKKVE
jgi:hypothetical protein